MRSFGGNTTPAPRFASRSAPDSTLAGSEVVLLGSDTSNPCPPAANDVDCITANSPHDLNTVRVDKRDGTLWVSNGDGPTWVRPTSFNAQDPQSLHGKLLHVDRNGRGLPGHPFCPADNNLGPSARRSPRTGSATRSGSPCARAPGPVMGDVGWIPREEVDVVAPGDNYGWPCYEGTSARPTTSDNPRCAGAVRPGGHAEGAVGPIHDYPTPRPVGRITGGPVTPAAAYPAGYTGDVFFADYVDGFIKRLSLNSAGTTTRPRLRDRRRGRGRPGAGPTGTWSTCLNGAGAADPFTGRPTGPPSPGRRHPRRSGRCRWR